MAKISPGVSHPVYLIPPPSVLTNVIISAAPCVTGNENSVGSADGSVTLSTPIFAHIICVEAVLVLVKTAPVAVSRNVPSTVFEDVPQF